MEARMTTTAGRTPLALLIAGTLVSGLGACGSSGGNGGGGQTLSKFVGIVSTDDGSMSGSITVTVQTATPAPPVPTGPSLMAPVTASGTLQLGGTQTSLTGTYDPDTDILAITGGGYTFGGGFDGVDRIEGLWTGPGNITGTFVTTQSNSGTAFCGTFIQDDQMDSGTFSFVISGNTLRGEAVSSVNNDVTPLEGAVSGNAITIYFPGTTIALAVGTRSGTTVSGTFDDLEGTTGTWSGGACQ
jgi:hypothetical protein